MLKRSGARQAVLNGRSAVSLEFYPSFQALTRALEKNGTSIPFPAILVGNLLLGGLECGFLAGFGSGHLPLVLLSAVTWAVAAGATLGLCRWLGFKPGSAWIPFLGVLPLAWAMIRSGALALVRGGVMWRGTFYPAPSSVRGCGWARGRAPRAVHLSGRRDGFVRARGREPGRTNWYGNRTSSHEVRSIPVREA